MANRTRYRKKYVPIILEMARKRCTDVEIARAIGVPKSTLSSWLKKYPELYAQLLEAKEAPIREVEGNFYRRANGYTIQVRRIKVDPSDPKHEKIQEITVVDKHFPPSVPAGMFILANKLGGEYKIRQSIEHSGNVGIKTYVGWTPDEWDAIDVEGKEVLPGGDGTGQKQITGGNGEGKS
jgi:DNA-binding transcriptional ArsR family regulator